jgi:4-hydroxybenzoate polyprenyltransferase
MRERKMQKKPSLVKALLKSMRPRQWPKNVAIFAALVFDRQLTRIEPLERTLISFFLFCLISSAVYIINDIMDVEADRNHPEKKNRPIASGALPIPIAIAFAILLWAIAFPIAYMLSPYFAAIGAFYVLMNLAYSKWLKHIPLLDVFILAAGFVIRVAAGVTVISVERFSPWLYVVTTLLSLYLGFGKRRAELSLLASGAHTHRKVLDGYTIPLLDQLITIVSSTTLIAYSLYTFSAPNLPANHTMMLTVPFVMYGIFRYLYIIQVKNSGGAPEEMLLTDRPLQVAIGLWGITVLIIFYLF